MSTPGSPSFQQAEQPELQLNPAAAWMANHKLNATDKTFIVVLGIPVSMRASGDSSPVLT
jgi:hypothetical protein